jgi:hypothetical protein
LRAVEEKRLAGRAETKKLVLKDDIGDIKILLPLLAKPAVKEDTQTTGLPSKP